MIQILVRLFIKDYNNYTNTKVREHYGTFCSLLSILCNIVLVVFKLIIGFITNSIAIQADAFNNLSDVGSNLASLFGFKLANKHSDQEHPYGHGRIEYVSGLIIAFLILLVGIQSLKDSLLKIVYPEKVLFTYVAVIILIGSILIKLWMCSFNKSIGTKINSSTLLAAGQDSLNDVVTTSATLIALFLTLVTDLPVDGIFGVFVSGFVLKAGVDVFKDTVDPLLGKAPDKELIQEILAVVNSYEDVLGIHDLMMHDYGPGRKFLTMHIEVDASRDVMEIHDSMDLIERDIYARFHILTTVHMDPIVTNDQFTNDLREKTKQVIQSINPLYSIHDFRTVPGVTHTNLIFDVLIPADDEIAHKELKSMIDQKIKEIDPTYFTVVQIDHQFI